MKRVLIFIPLLINAENFNALTKMIDNSLSYKMAKNQVKIYKNKLKAVKSKNYGSIELKYNYAYLFSTPTMKMDSMQPVAVNPVSNTLIYKSIHSELEVGDKNNFSFELIYSYPIFTGFKIRNSIEKSKLELLKSKLDLQNIRRVLTLKVAEIYANIYSLKQQKKALLLAKNALDNALSQVQSFYNLGLAKKSDLELLRAKYYEMIAKIRSLDTNIKSLFNILSFILNKRIDSIDGLPNISIKTANLKNRADIKALKAVLDISDKDIDLVKGDFYPNLGLQVGIKREANNFTLTKNDYQNIDKSFIGVGLDFKFDGSKKVKLEIAKIVKNINYLKYQDYFNQIKSEYENDKLKLKALNFRLESAINEEKARNIYYNEVYAKFKEGIVDSVKLQESISKLAESRAKIDAIKAQIFLIKERLKLNSGKYYEIN